MNKAPYEQGSVGDVTNGSATIASLTQGFTWDALGQPATVTYPRLQTGETGSQTRETGSQLLSAVLRSCNASTLMLFTSAAAVFAGEPAAAGWAFLRMTRRER